VTRLAENLDSAYWLGLAVAATTFIVWFHRAYTNLGAFSDAPREYSPSAAIYGWFIPFANLVWPYKIATEIWAGSQRSPDERPSTGAGILGLWWTAWIVSGFLGTLMLRQLQNPRNLDEAVSAQWWSVTINGLRVIAAVIAMIAVKKITERQMNAVPQAQKLADKPTPSSK
jgi:hypothetical protein